MNRRPVHAAIASVVAGLLAMGFAAPAFAEPGQGQGLQTEQLTCNGIPMTITIVPGGEAGFGVPGFRDGIVKVLDSVTATENGVVVYSKTYGQRNGTGNPVTCIGTKGTLTFIVTASGVGPAAK